MPIRHQALEGFLYNDSEINQGPQPVLFWAVAQKQVTGTKSLAGGKSNKISFNYAE